MVWLSMILSFFVYPFYSIWKTIVSSFKDKTKFSVYGMEDHTYVMNFSVLFGKYFVVFSSIINTAIVAFIIKVFAKPPLWLFVLTTFSAFLTFYWIYSGIIYFLELLYYISSNTRKILQKIDNLDKETKRQDKEIVH
jgi:hypothetical protein